MSIQEPSRYRRSIRLRGYDYRQMGAYFVTICTNQRQCLFGEIRDRVMYPNRVGFTVESIWNRLPFHFPFLELDAFILMPNHLHGILVIIDDRSFAPSAEYPPKGTKSGSLGATIQNFKSVSTRRINGMNGNRGTIWQRNYYEHIIRTDRAYENIRRYITENPQHWHEDPDNPSRPIPDL